MKRRFYMFIDAENNELYIDIDTINAISSINKKPGLSIVYCQDTSLSFTIKLAPKELLEKLSNMGVLEQLTFVKTIGKK